MSTYELLDWKRPPQLPKELIPVRASSRLDFINRFLAFRRNSYCDRNFWEMTEAQRETWKNEIASDWVYYYDKIGRDGTPKHLKQLADMDRLGSGMILIGQEGGMGKSQLLLSHLKRWVVLKYRHTGELHRPSMYWRRVQARKLIGGSAPNTAHGIDEDQDDSGSGSAAVVKQLKNLYKTGLRKPGRLIVHAGIDVDPREMGRSVSLYLKPFGFNRHYQANRFIVYNNQNEPLWIAALQRCILPHETILYEGEIGTVAEYEARAKEFSIDTDGIHSARDAQAELYWMHELVSRWTIMYPDRKAKIKALTFHARQIGIPEPVIDSLEEIVGAAQEEIAVLVEAKGDSYDPIPRDITSEGWEQFRQRLETVALRFGASQRDAKALGLYYVPDVPLWSYKDIHRELELGRRPSPDSLGTQIRRRLTDIPTKEVGDIGELCVLSWLDSLRATGGQATKEQPDILIPPNEEHGTTEIALNVKTSLDDSFREYVPTTPEYDWRPHALIVLLLPRLLELRLFPISQPKQTINAAGGVLTTTAKLGDTILRMCEEVEE